MQGTQSVVTLYLFGMRGIINEFGWNIGDVVEFDDLLFHGLDHN